MIDLYLKQSLNMLQIASILKGTYCFYVPPGKAAGHIVFGLSVRPSFRPSVRVSVLPSVRPSVRPASFGTR